MDSSINNKVIYQKGVNWIDTNYKKNEKKLIAKNERDISEMEIEKIPKL